MCHHLSANHCPPGYTDAVDADGRIVEGLWRTDLCDGRGTINPTTQRNPQATATAVRDTIIDYLSNEGTLLWQVQYVNRVGLFSFLSAQFTYSQLFTLLFT